MRQELASRAGTRGVYRGRFERFGTKSAFRGPPLKTVLLMDIVDGFGNAVCDHLWFNFTKGFAALDLQPGDVVEFHARSKQYVKGYQGRREDVYDAPVQVDYKLSNPTRLRKVVASNSPNQGELM